MGTRKTRQVEGPFLSQYILTRYPNFPVLYDQGLGTVPDEYLIKYGFEKGIAFYDPQRYHIDAIVLLPRFFLLIEAKVWEVMMGLGKLQLYKSLVHITPDLKRYEPRDILLELVVARTKSDLEVMAREADVRLVLFTTPEVEKVVEERNLYQTPEYRARREQVLRDRELLGLE